MLQAELTRKVLSSVWAEFLLSAKKKGTADQRHNATRSRAQPFLLHTNLAEKEETRTAPRRRKSEPGRERVAKREARSQK